MTGSSVPDPSNRVPPVGLLARAGFKQGDYVPLVCLTPTQSRDLSTTSTTWDTSAIFVSVLGFVWNSFIQGEQGAVAFSCRAIPGTDETMGVQLRNFTDGESMAEKTGITSDNRFTTGPVEYEPTTKESSIVIRMSVRTDPGANSSAIYDPVATIGVIL